MRAIPVVFGDSFAGLDEVGSPVLGPSGGVQFWDFDTVQIGAAPLIVEEVKQVGGSGVKEYVLIGYYWTLPACVRPARTALWESLRRVGVQIPFDFFHN